jgi:hypothetical protein
MPIETGPKPEDLNGAASETQDRPLSLREVAEAAYDEVERGISPDDDDDGQREVDDGSVRRDARGRFAPKGEEPGEAAASEPPSPDDKVFAPQPEAPTQPHPGEAAEAPANWSAQDRQTFEKLPPEGKAFLLRRHSEMEGDYQRRVQATGAAAQFGEAIAREFGDPVVQGSLQHAGLTPVDAVRELLKFQRWAQHPDPAQKVAMLHAIARNIGLDPATVFAASRQDGPVPALSEEDRKNPAIRYFADHLGRTSTEVQQLRNTIHQMVEGSQRQAAEQQLKVTKWGIDSFAEEKDDRGNLAHPHFDAVLPQIIELFKANPQRDLREAYQTALWMAPETRQAQLDAAARQRSQKAANERAVQANRSNVRGRTSPVTGKPPADPNKPKSLRETIAEAAEEIGF